LILPLGGITIFEDIIDQPLKEEILVAISGPLMQILFTILVNLLFGINETFNYYSILILLFNLLPIYPLDGAKILNVGFNKFFPFKLSYILILDLSFFLLVTLFCLTNNLMLFLGLSFLAFNLIKEYKNFSYLFKNFLLERILYKIKYPKIRIIKGKNFNKMYRNSYHFFIIDKNKLSEEFILAKTFDFTRLL
jgi:stage IV sporulation protein FB